VTDPADADVIRTVQGDAVPGQRAIGGGELVAARADVGGAPLHLDVDHRVLANRQADSGTCFIDEPLFCRANLEAPQRQAGRLIVPPAVGCDRARFTCIDVLDCHRDIAKGCAGFVCHHAGNARSRLGPRRKCPHRKQQKHEQISATHSAS
jgi:hypothetical protein